MSIGFAPTEWRRLSKRLFGRRMQALNQFFANPRIVPCHHQNRRVLLHREALVSDSLHKGIVGPISNGLLVGRVRCFNPLLIIVLDAGDLL